MPHVVVFLTLSVYQDVILDDYDPFEAAEDVGHCCVAFSRRCRCPHHENLETIYPVNAVELKQVLGYLVQ